MSKEGKVNNVTCSAEIKKIINRNMFIGFYD